MKKITTILTALFLLFSFSALKAGMGIGVTGAIHSIEADGTETARDSAEKNTGSHSEDVAVPEIFVEALLDNGFAIGMSYVPVRDMGSKSRTDTNGGGDTGTYTAAAELDDVMQAYVDVPLFSVMNFPFHAKLGIQHVNLKTLESLNSGSTYPDANLLGYTIGLGVKGDIGSNMYYKVEATFTDFETYESESSASNKVTADIDSTAGRLSLGYKF